MLKQPIIFKELPFDYGHRVFGHPTKCGSLHGHRGIAVVYAQGDLDSLGRVIDFSVLKERIGGWVDEFWDHTTILYREDLELISAISPVKAYKPLFILPTNPTAENLAQYLLDEVCPKLMEGTGIEIVKVQMWETPTSCAEVVK